MGPSSVKKTEIGSEFWDVPTCAEKNMLFPETAQWFLSGRSALRSIIADIKQKNNVHTVAMPSWCCDSMILPFLEQQMEVLFYPVTVSQGFHQKLNVKADVTLVMDYFGFRNAPEADSTDGIVIRDLTHSLFSGTNCNADYFFGSVRKWCGVWTGGFAYGKDMLPPEMHAPDEDFLRLRRQAMEEKERYIAGISVDKNYLQAFGEAEEYLDRDSLVRGSVPRDIQAARHLDVEYIRKKRRENAAVLLEELNGTSVQPIFREMSEDDCPLFVPVVTEHRDALRRFLIENRVYCPVHWPVSEYHTLTEEMKSIYETELSIVCDQRYNTEDMRRICSLIRMGAK